MGCIIMERELITLAIITVIGIIKLIMYFADARREERGEPSRHREYMGRINQNKSMDFVEEWRSELEEIKYMRENTEQNQRNNYNFSDRNAGMDDIYSMNKDGNK